MDEIEYKLKTNNSVLVVNAIDKLINIIKSKYKPGERQRFVLENEELKFLRDKCSSTNTAVSLTACQGLLALVELGVLEIAHTMSTVVTLLPSAHNYSVIISTMAGLLVLDLKSRLLPGEQYKCQFSLSSPQHPFIRVLQKNKDAEDDVLAQMHALCTHPDYIISSNSLELLKPVFMWLTYHPQRSAGTRPWQLLLSLPESQAQSTLLLKCITCQQICNPKLVESAFAAISAVVDAAIYQQKVEHVMAFLPLLARVSNELIKHGRDPRCCYSLMERCVSLDAPALRNAAGLALALLAENLLHTSALYLHELFNLCLNIISKYEYTSICLNAFVGLSLQWLHLPSYLTANALKVASKILDTYQQDDKEHFGLHMANLRSNTVYQTLVYTDGHLFTVSKILETYERLRDNPTKLESWFDTLVNSNNDLRMEMLPFFVGFVFMRKGDESLVFKAIKVIIELVSIKKEVSVAVLPVLVYKIANDERPRVKLECLRGFPLMASTKENVPSIVSVLNKLKTNKGVPTSLLIMLYTSLAETQVRCFPYLQELLVDSVPGRPDDLKWEVEIAKAVAVKRICELRGSSHGLELVSVISSTLTRCSDRAGATATQLALDALAALWRARAVAPPSTWRALEPRLGKDARVAVQVALCKLLSEVPSLRSEGAEYDALVAQTARRLWRYLAEGTPPTVSAAAAALAAYDAGDYALRDVPEIYRKTVKLPASFCKTPADALRKPEDVLDYIPCEVWPEVFKYTNQAALGDVTAFVRCLIAREVSAYRGGVYRSEGRAEPQSVAYLPAASVARGVIECFRKQITSPSYDVPEAVLLAMFDTLASEYPKPLPPLDLSFLHMAYDRGQQWKERCFTLAARQAAVSPSAKNLVENVLHGLESGTAEEFDVMLLFDNLPVLCRAIQPNTLRGPLETSLVAAFAAVSGVKAKGQDPGDLLFVRQLRKIEECLDCDEIHDANRTLLSQLVESYFSVIPDDNVAWAGYVSACRPLATAHLERMTSPSGWWEVSAALLCKASAVRAALARAPAASPLVWLNECVDAHAAEITCQEFSLRCFLPALRAALPDTASTVEWLLQLMARTQVAFHETEDESSKLYLCDVFMLSVIVFSGHWSFEPDSEALVCSRATRQALLPAAVAALLSRAAWTECTHQMIEWLWHTRGATGDPGAASACLRAMLALRHTDQFAAHNVWMRL